MNAARAYRRLKEVEEQKLKNRVLLLKVELAKSKKKIEETRTRTDAIVKHRNEIMEKHARKVEEDARLYNPPPPPPLFPPPPPPQPTRPFLPCPPIPPSTPHFPPTSPPTITINPARRSASSTCSSTPRHASA